MNALVLVSILGVVAVGFFLNQYGSIVTAERFLLWAYIIIQKRKARMKRYAAQSEQAWTRTLESSWLESADAPAPTDSIQTENVPFREAA